MEEFSFLMCFSQKVLTKLLKFLFAGKREQCDGKRQHKKIEKIPGKKMSSDRSFDP